MKPISVLMCVYNREKYLPAAIESILNQSFRDFEFVIVNDGSTDRSNEILASFAKKDSRIKVIQNPENLGIVQSVSKGLEYCSGKYILRMDSDDVSLPDRFQAQITYMQSHPEVDILGTAYDFIDEDGVPTGVTGTRPVDSMITWFQMFYHSAIINGTIIARSEVYNKFNQDNLEENYVASEDIAFFLRIGFDHRMSNLPDVLYRIRLHQAQVSELHVNSQRDGTIKATQQAFSKFLDDNISLDVVRSFYYTRHYTIDNPGINTRAQNIMCRFQKTFEKVYKLDMNQKKETRLFTYTRIKNYTMKYRHNIFVLINGLYCLLIIRPEGLFKDTFERIFHLNGLSRKTIIPANLFFLV